jgi:putative transcription factor
MGCDMCGVGGQLYKVLIEGTQMTVCEKCSRFGKVKSRIKSDKEIEADERRQEIYDTQRRLAQKNKETVFVIVDNYSSLVKNARESMKLKQEEVAKKMAVKESILHNIESGHFEPSIDMARRLEKFFGITLVEQHEEEDIALSKGETGPMTLGDMIKIKKK